MAAATTKWGAISDWDVSGVGDFSYAFSADNAKAADGKFFPASNGNPKALTFVGTGMSSWITTSLTSLANMFSKAAEMNADLSAWNVAKVVTMKYAFDGAKKFAGTGLATWITTSLTTLAHTCWKATEMNADLSGWKVAKVVTMKNTFNGAKQFAGTGLATWITTSLTTLENTFHGFQFEGAGLSSWDTAKVTSLSKTFYSAPNFNADLSAWKVAKVTTLEGAFDKTLKFEGRGLSAWDTSAVTNLKYTFLKAAMNVDLSGWNVAKVTSLYKTFEGASKFNSDISGWDTGKVTDIDSCWNNYAFNQDVSKWNILNVNKFNGFSSGNGMDSCNKRKLALAW
jgi:surface protein